ncbi:MAG: hypothetical protein K0Q79_1590 [Flavipsychrobacter sp.]|nr:hypothetical protein [Flavipsychrobacter sp.]
MLQAQLPPQCCFQMGTANRCSLLTNNCVCNGCTRLSPCIQTKGPTLWALFIYYNFRLVPVMICLVRAFLWKTKVFRLCVCQFFKLSANLCKVQARYFLIKVLR